MDSKSSRYARPFTSRADFERHFKTTACRKLRGLEQTGPYARKLISDQIACVLNSFIRKKSGEDGTILFLCPICEGLTMYRNRY